MSSEKMEIDSNVEEEISSASAPATKELIVLGCYKNLFLCREKCLNGRVVTFKTTLNDGIPGSIITVNPTQESNDGKYPEISGILVSVRYCAKDLNLEPIPLADFGIWSLKDEYYGKDGEPLPDWFKSISERGERTRLAFQPTGPYGDPFGMAAARKMSGDINLDDPESMARLSFNLFHAPGTLLGPPETNPINKANTLIKDGKIKAAKKLLMDLLAKDLRCLDAHAILGEIEIDENPEKALLHYQMGVSIGQLSLENQIPDPVIAWSFLENRPFLRCVYGTAICAWMSRNLRLAKEIILKILSLNPGDNQGVRFMLPYIEEDGYWDEYRYHQIIQGNIFQGTMCYNVWKVK